MKRILTIQDISCVGKCSLTVALPIISACGVECCVLPTAVLSTHTAFKDFTFRDLADDMLLCARHWKNQNINFNALYTGYIGSFKQLEIVSEILGDFKSDDNFILVDPVMADNGELYHGFDQKFANQMALLCSKADVIVPNLTEASFMLGVPYASSGYSEKYIKELLFKLTALGCKTAILTGISFNEKDIGIYGYNKTSNEYFYYFRERLPESFHGTGDIFASTMCGAMTNGKSVKESAQIAVDYTVECIKKTVNNPNHNWYGVDFESAIPYLIAKISQNHQ